MKRTILLLVATLIVTVGCQPAPTPTSVPPTAVPPTSTPVPVPPTPTAPPLTGIAVVVKNYFDARNAKNVDAAMAFFTDDAVYTNHFGTKYEGKAAIRPLVQHDADQGYQFELSNFQVTGSKATFHVKGVGNNPSEGDLEAIVQGDKITSMIQH